MAFCQPWQVVKKRDTKTDIFFLNLLSSMLLAAAFDLSMKSLELDIKILNSCVWKKTY